MPGDMAAQDMRDRGWYARALCTMNAPRPPAIGPLSLQSIKHCLPRSVYYSLLPPKMRTQSYCFWAPFSILSSLSTMESITFSPVTPLVSTCVSISLGVHVGIQGGKGADMTTNLPQQALYSAVTRAVSGALSMGASLSHHCDPACSPINMGISVKQRDFSTIFSAPQCSRIAVGLPD